MFVTEQLPSQFCVKIQGNMDILSNKEVFLAVFRWIQTSQITGQVSVAQEWSFSDYGASFAGLCTILHQTLQYFARNIVLLSCKFADAHA